jgi:dipeptidyl-peptidase-4
VKNFISSLLIVIISLVQVNAQSKITVEDIWYNYKFYPKAPRGINHLNDGIHYSLNLEEAIAKYELLSGDFIEVLFNAKQFYGVAGFSGKIDDYTFSFDEQKILIKSEAESIYRHSQKAEYFVFDIQNASFRKLYNGEKQSNATFSPDGQKVAFVVNNDLYYVTIKDMNSKQITHDGKINEIINGMSDWVYEEEFKLKQAFSWSPDSKYIAFLRFDESKVREYTLTSYNNELYPETMTYKYPKVGEENSKVELKIFNLKKKKSRKANLPSGTNYIPRIKWTNDADILSAIVLNRLQNHLQLFRINASNGRSKVILEERDERYINLPTYWNYLSDGKHFLWTSEREGFNQLYLYDLKGRKKKKLTDGNYDVTACYGIDNRSSLIYYQSAEKSPLERHIYQLGINGKNKKKLTSANGWYDAHFTKNFNYFIGEHSSLNSPPTHRLFDNKGRLFRDIEINPDIPQYQKIYQTNRIEFFEFENTSNYQLNGYYIKPDNFNPSTQYPVLMYVYGGPGSQSVEDKWLNQNYWWFQMLADEGYIVACVDGRGTGGRGTEFRKMTYLKLGHYESIDIIETAQFLGHLPFVDADRIGIFGWSYGGYLSALCLFKGADIFKLGIAVAPVTNWKWYDTIYTERFMRTEKENPDGYRLNAPIYYAYKLEGHLLLMHGMSDDNVHFQHSVELANALIQSNKQFDTHYYPNCKHGIYKGIARMHLYTKMTNFIKDHL